MPNNPFGDFQTPYELALQCLRTLDIPHNARIFEPTCGNGTFLRASADVAPHSERCGIEINPEYAANAREWADVTTGNIFRVAMPNVARWRTGGPLFVVGNPPWVTAAELKRMDSDNLPEKANFKQVRGLDALLGSSNFDVCEFIILKALREFSTEPFTLGMLCKTQVARNVIDYAASIDLPVTNSAIYRIDAMSWFNAGVDACWFTVRIDPAADREYSVDVFDDVFNLDASPTNRFGVVGGQMVSDIAKYESVRAADGKSPLTWRSGLKHDASFVFELKATPEPTTKEGEVLSLETEYVYPLLKSTDIFRGRYQTLSKWVIVPQLSFGAETKHLEQVAPNLWHYLCRNHEILDGRKSSIYRNRPRFSVFGHGEYTFAPFKVVVSGLHKEAIFRLVTPINGKPVVVDDTCYLLAFSDITEAAVVACILNSPQCQDLIQSLVFWDSKRPITKKLLSRLDLNNLQVDKRVILEAAKDLAGAAGFSVDGDYAVNLFGNIGTAGRT